MSRTSRLKRADEVAVPSTPLGLTNTVIPPVDVVPMIPAIAVRVCTPIVPISICPLSPAAPAMAR